MVVYEALAKRRPKSRRRGRRGTPAEGVLRLLTLKHIRNWSYEELEREVRANLVYRDFTRVGGGKMPDAKTMGRWGVALGLQVLKQIHARMVKIAQAKGVTTGRRMCVDTTVVETNIHHPTDSTLLGDGVRVLTRSMKKITQIAGLVGTKLRDPSRRVGVAVINALDLGSHGRHVVYEPLADVCRRADRPVDGSVDPAQVMQRVVSDPRADALRTAHHDPRLAMLAERMPNSGVVFVEVRAGRTQPRHGYQ